MKRGRPETYTKERADQFCELLATGRSIRLACAEEGMPSESVVYRWLASIPDFRENYARAREIRSDARFERVDSVLDDMRAGLIDAHQARVEIDAIKWQTGKEAPKKYGDKVQQEISGPDGGAIPTRVTIEFV